MSLKNLFSLPVGLCFLSLVLWACADKTDFYSTDVDVLDVDGDGVVAELDCDDQDALVGEAQPWFPDSDEDQYGNQDSAAVVACDALPGFVDNAKDCDDADSAIYPGAAEFCDEIDNDCDGAIDEDALDTVVFCADVDEDGFGAQDNCEALCAAPSGWLEDNSDCDDVDEAISPAADEACNGMDDDCDGEIDNDVDVWYAWLDVDGDGYGDSEQPICADLTQGIVDNDLDCDDEDKEINPDGLETCNGFDDDCDGIPDDSVCSCPVEVYDGRPYQMCAGGSSWEDAFLACKADGYHLVTVDDAAENTWVSDTAASYRDNDTWWIGYTDTDSEGKWTWSTSASVGYVNWNFGEPNGGTGENCAHLYTHMYLGHGVWNDESCSSSKHFVCEFSN